LEIYDKLGVKRVINCVSTTSPLGSSVVHPDVMEAMKDTSKYFICLDDLQYKAGKVIAELTNAEAAIVTSGCDAALTMATAACMMKGTPLDRYNLSLDRPSREQGEWYSWMQKLPNDTDGIKNEIILQQCHLNSYSQAHRVAGAKIIPAGTERQCNTNDIENKINDSTAAIAFVGMYAYRGVSLEEVLRISKLHSIPIIMDASYTLPPRINLKRWGSMGVDLVCYSGGKSIRGPTDTGILCGRRNLVTLAAIQMSPHHGVGRGFKVDKTQIVGLLKALQIYVEQDDNEEFSSRKNKAQYISNNIRNLRGVHQVEIKVPKTGLLRGWPVVTLSLNEKYFSFTTKEVVDRLYTGNPGIWTYYDNILCPGGITMNTQNLLEGEEIIVIKRLREILGT